MKMRSSFILLLLLCIMLLAVSGQVFANPSSSAPDEVDAPDSAGTMKNPGIFIIGSTDLYSDTYGISGDVQYFTWRDQNPSQGAYTFGGMDAYIYSHSANGKTVGLSFLTTGTRWESPYEPGVICAELGMPAWAMIEFSSNVDTATVKSVPGDMGSPIGTWRRDIDCTYPLYMSSLYQQRMTDWVRALARRLFVDFPELGAKVEFISMAHGVDGETRPVENQDEAGYRSGLGGRFDDGNDWVTAVNEITNIWVDEFRDAGANVPLFLNGAPFYLHPSERASFSQHAVQVKEAGLAILGLYPDFSGAIYGAAGGCPNCGQHDALALFKNSVPIAWETYQHMLPNNRDLYWALLHALHYQSDYIRIRRQFVYEDATQQPVVPNINVIKQWKDYFGKSIYDPPPSVWVAMRDHRNPLAFGSQGFQTNSTWAPLGNFEFFMQQVDDVPNGQTVIETNTGTIEDDGIIYQVELGLCPPASGVPSDHPCNPSYSAHNDDLPDSVVTGSQGGNQFLSNIEAYFARRTDGSSNYMMWFDVDNAYIGGGGTYSTTVTIKYFDIGNDKFRLYYDSTGGPTYAAPDGSSNPWVQKTGSNQLRTVTFTITDARMNGGLTGGMDFAIDRRNESDTWDGDEWIHLVDVKRLEGPPPPATNTPTITPTWTASPTTDPFATNTPTSIVPPTSTPTWTWTPLTTSTWTHTPTRTPTATPTPSWGVVRGIAYHDTNSNSQYDEGVDTPLSGALITLKRTNILLRAALTQADGKYVFAELQPDQYTINEESVPSGYVLTTIDSVTFPLTANYTFEYDFGHEEVPTPTLTPTITPTATPTPTHTPTPTLTPTPTPTVGHIVGIVYWDQNGNDSYDIGESTLAGAVIALSRLPGVIPVGEDTTGADGVFGFYNLPPGQYLMVETDPSGYGSGPGGNQITLFVEANRTSLWNFRDVPLGNTPTPTRTPTVTPTATATALSGAGAISGSVWRDNNRNGLLDVGEQGLASVAVFLYKDVNGNQLLDAADTHQITQVTGGNGSYQFTNISAAMYLVRQINQDGYFSTTPDVVPRTVTDGSVLTINFGDRSFYQAYIPIFIR